MDERLPQVNVIPAQPGYFQLEPIYRDDRTVSELWENSIIAWRVTTEVKSERQRKAGQGETWSSVEAVTVNGVDDNDDYAILLPNGNIELPFVQSFTSRDEYVKYLNDEQARQKEPRAA